LRRPIKAAWIAWILPLVVLPCLLGCGRKAPPFLPKEAFSTTVRALAGEWQDGLFLLSGSVTDLNGDRTSAAVRGCRVYHAHFPLEAPPCKGCPIRYEGFREVREAVVTDGRFRCTIELARKAGYHCMEVRLKGPNDALGPPSDRICITVK
jgi:predicted small lipoprotein YifL